MSDQSVQTGKVRRELSPDRAHRVQNLGHERGVYHSLISSKEIGLEEDRRPQQKGWFSSQYPLISTCNLSSRGNPRLLFP